MIHILFFWSSGCISILSIRSYFISGTVGNIISLYIKTGHFELGLSLMCQNNSKNNRALFENNLCWNNGHSMNINVWVFRELNLSLNPCIVVNLQIFGHPHQTKFVFLSHLGTWAPNCKNYESLFRMVWEKWSQCPFFVSLVFLYYSKMRIIWGIIGD